MQAKISVLFGAISIVVFGGILAVLVMMPQSASQAQTDVLRQAIDRASRIHNQTLGLMGGATVKVDGKLPPTFEKVEKGDEKRITVLDARQQNTVIPKRLDELEKDLKAALDKTPEAREETKAAVHSLVGQILAAKAQYYLRSAENAEEQADRAMVAMDTGILSVQERLVNIRQIAPLTQTRETVAGKMKTDADADVTRLESAIAVETSAITELQTARAKYLAAATEHSNKASELRTLSATADRDKKRELQEQSFIKENLANKAGLDAEDAQTKVDKAKSAVTMMNLGLTSAKARIASATEVLKGFTDKQAAAKRELDKETLAMNTTGQEIAKNAAALIVACGKVDAGQVSAVQQYAAALEAMKQFRQHSLDSSAEAIGSEAGILMDKAETSKAFVSSRQTVKAISARLKVLWETAALEGNPPKAAEMAAFAGKAENNKDAAAKGFSAAAKLYEEATTKADTRFKWNYQCRELQARRARHRLTGDADDKTRASLLEKELEPLKGFPYVDSAL